MSDDTRVLWQPANPAKIARLFSRLGWTGFWIQLVLIIVLAFTLWLLFQVS